MATKETVEHAESKHPVEPSTNQLVHTIKGWIAESQERKRTQRHSFTALTTLCVLILTAFAFAAMAPNHLPQTDRPLTPEEKAIKVTIATTSGFLGQPANRYKVGDQIPVSITMTNTSTKPVYTCISSDLYQDLPQLTRDGKVVPFSSAQSFETITPNAITSARKRIARTGAA